jgi:hypothetical protein
MEIIMMNAREAGMPEEMISHCQTLIGRRIEKKFNGKVDAGADVTILYSEKDPLGTSDQVDDHAYDIYFTVEKVEGDKVHVRLEM